MTYSVVAQYEALTTLSCSSEGSQGVTTSVDGVPGRDWESESCSSSSTVLRNTHTGTHAHIQKT